MKTRDSTSLGFTLVEVVIAAALLTLSLTALIVTLVQSRRSAALASNRLEAIHIARQEMEALCSSNYFAIVSRGGYTYTGSFNTIYTGSNTVNNNPTNSVKDIVVTISWVNPLGKAISTVSIAGSACPQLRQ